MTITTRYRLYDHKNKTCLTGLLKKCKPLVIYCTVINSKTFVTVIRRAMYVVPLPRKLRRKIWKIEQNLWKDCAKVLVYSCCIQIW